MAILEQELPSKAPDFVPGEQLASSGLRSQCLKQWGIIRCPLLPGWKFHYCGADGTPNNHGREAEGEQDDSQSSP